VFVAGTAAAEGTFPLQIDVVPIGPHSGTVFVVPPGAACTASCTYTYPSASVVTLSALPARRANGQQPVFNGWGGDCDGEADCTLTMDRPHEASAGFVVVPTRGRVPRELALRKIVAVCFPARRLLVTVQTSFSGPARARLTRRGHAVVTWNSLRVKRGRRVLRLALPGRVRTGSYGVELRVGTLPDAIAAGGSVHIPCGRP
jgi:hypothetical protein